VEGKMPGRIPTLFYKNVPEGKYFFIKMFQRAEAELLWCDSKWLICG
jgi:hypothetical protein